MNGIISCYNQYTYRNEKQQQQKTTKTLDYGLEHVHKPPSLAKGERQNIYI